MNFERPEYFHRIARMVVDLGTDILLKVFKMYIPSEYTIETFLRSRYDDLISLKRENILHDMHFILINKGDATQFDFWLLYNLIRYLTHIQPPINGWDNEYPGPSDKSPGSYLNRLIAILHVAVTHTAKITMIKSEFGRFCKDSEEVLVELAGLVGPSEKAAIQQKIAKTKAQPLFDQYEYIAGWMEDLPERLKNTTVDYSTLKGLAQALGHNWQQFALADLRVSKIDTDIAPEKRKYPFQPMYNALVHWKDVVMRNRQEEATNVELLRLMLHSSTAGSIDWQCVKTCF